MKRQIIERATHSDMGGNLEAFLKDIRSWVESVVPSNRLHTAYVSVEKEEHYYSDLINVSAVLQVTWTRDETDEEEKVREQRDNQYKAARRAQYEELKKEFG